MSKRFVPIAEDTGVLTSEGEPVPLEDVAELHLLDNGWVEFILKDGRVSLLSPSVIENSEYTPRIGEL